MSNFYYWTHCSANKKFDFYGFLDDEYFDHNHKAYMVIRETLPPHDLWCDTYNVISNIRGCGKKNTLLIIDIMDKYKRENEKAHSFCECEEPLLHWYKYCPTCGKEVSK